MQKIEESNAFTDKAATIDRAPPKYPYLGIKKIPIIKPITDPVTMILEYNLSFL